MPNLTFFIDQNQMLNDETVTTLTEQCTTLCTEILRAKLDNVHIIFVPVRLGRGHTIFAEINYRLEPFRTQNIMDLFMTKMDEVIKQQTGITARIRCFGFTQGTIYARN